MLVAEVAEAGYRNEIGKPRRRDTQQKYPREDSNLEPLAPETTLWKRLNTFRKRFWGTT